MWCREDSHPAALPKKPFALTWCEAVRVLLHRQWKLTVRDGSLVRGRIIQVSVIPPRMHVPACARALFAPACACVPYAVLSLAAPATHTSCCAKIS